MLVVICLLFELFDFDLKPKVLIADAAGAITCGFNLCFGDSFKRVMCWYHAIAAVHKRLEALRIDEDNFEAIRFDICALQICEN